MPQSKTTNGSKELDDDTRKVISLGADPGPVFTRMKADEQAVFDWFCDNGYAPPVHSEIVDLLMRLYGV